MKNKTIGFIGCGMMGAPMALRLIGAGYNVKVWNRTSEKALQLINRGAERTSDIADLAGDCPVIITMVSDDNALRAVADGRNGLIDSMRRDGIAIDMSTVSPSLSRTLAGSYASKGKRYIQAPVLGSVPQANDGSLLIFAGGDNEAIDSVQPVFDVLGRRTWRFGKPEQSATMKLVCNLFIASMINTLGEGLLLAGKAKIDGTILLEILNESALAAPMYQTKGKSLIERRFAPRFMVQHMEKDLSLIRKTARELGVPLPAVGVIHDLFLAAKNRGYGNEDYSAMVKVLEELAGEL